MYNGIGDKGDLLRRANIAYRDGNPIMSDGEYDFLEKDIRRSNPDDPILIEIEDYDFGITKKLTIAMGSQDKAHNLDEMNRFYNRINTNDLISASGKLDGFSIELTYKYANFVLALSRGNGDIGVDYTSLVRNAKGLLKTIKTSSKVTVVRGEIILLKEDLIELNKLLIADGRDPYQNTRNGAVGLVKTLKNREYSKFLSFKAFDIVEIN